MTIAIILSFVLIVLIVLLLSWVQQLNLKIAVRSRILEEYAELDCWSNAYELCADYLINTNPSIYIDNAHFDSMNRIEALKFLAGHFSKVTMPWYRELRMYVEGLNHTTEAKRRLLKILKDVPV